jgi:hypothetical protein
MKRYEQQSVTWCILGQGASIPPRSPYQGPAAEATGAPAPAPPVGGGWYVAGFNTVSLYDGIWGTIVYEREIEDGPGDGRGCPPDVPAGVVVQPVGKR